MEPSWSAVVSDGRQVRVVVTDRRHGDLSSTLDPDVLDERRRAVVDAPWVWLRQVHGADVVTATRPGEAAGTAADAVVTHVSDVPIAVQVADCAPVLLVDDAGVIGLAHAGWRGLVAGVLDATIARMVDLGASAPVAVLGPCIRPEAYEFGADDLDRVAAVLGDTVRSTTAAGTPALDVPEAVSAALRQLEVPTIAQLGGCTAAEADLRWSHRARGDRERQAVVAWLGAP